MRRCIYSGDSDVGFDKDISFLVGFRGCISRGGYLLSIVLWAGAGGYAVDKKERRHSYMGR